MSSQTQSHATNAAKALAEELVNTNPTIVDGACLVSLPDIGSTSGRITLKDAETFVLGTKVTSKAVRNGDLEVYPTKDLQIFCTIRATARRLVQSCSVQVGDLFLCPIAQLSAVIEGLEELQLKFETEVDLLGQRYDLQIESHKKQNPDIAMLIDKHKVSWSSFKKAFRFKFGVVLAVSPLLSHADELASAAAATLWDEIASEASALHRQSFAGHSKVTQRAIRPAEKIKDKLVNLSFLHSGIDQIVDQFDAVLQSLPQTGSIEGIDFLRFAHFLLGISTADNLRMMAEDSYCIALPELQYDETDILHCFSEKENSGSTTTIDQSSSEVTRGQSDHFVSHDMFQDPVFEQPPQVDVTNDGWGGF